MTKNKTILTLLILFINSCSAIVFEKGLGHEKKQGYNFIENKNSGSVTVKNDIGHVNVMLGRVACGSYGLIGPLIFPIIPVWESKNCNDITIRAWEYYNKVKNIYIIFNNKSYYPYKVSKLGYRTFPLKIKSIKNNATLVVEKENSDKFEIPIRYKHKFNFYLMPGG